MSDIDAEVDVNALEYLTFSAHRETDTEDNDGNNLWRNIWGAQ